MTARSETRLAKVKQVSMLLTSQLSHRAPVGQSRSCKSQVSPERFPTSEGVDRCQFVTVTRETRLDKQPGHFFAVP